MNPKKRNGYVSFLLLVLVSFSIAACGDQPTPVPAGVPTPNQSANQITSQVISQGAVVTGTPDSSGGGSSFAKPTATIKPSPTPKPSVTPKPTKESTQTPEPKPTATPKPSVTPVAELACVNEADFEAKYGPFKINDKKFGCIEGTVSNVYFALDTKGGAVSILFKDSLIGGGISKDQKANFDKASLQSLEGKKVRLKGILHVINMGGIGVGDTLDVVLNQPSQIEVL